MDLVAHRGWPSRYPENTLPGIRAALDAGARYIEIDVQLTGDKVPVLFHDKTLERVCGVRGSLHERTLARLQELAASEPARFGDRFKDVRVPTLEEACALLRGNAATVFVEVKPPPVERFGLETTVERVLEPLGGLGRRAVILSSLPEVLRACRGPTGLVLERWGAPGIACDYVFCDVRKLPARGDLRTGGARLAVYEVADAALARSLARRGADLVETFAIGEMLEALRAS